MRVQRLRTTGFAALAAASLVAATLAATSSSAGAAGTTKIKVQEAACAAAKAGHSNCDAMRVVVKKVSASKARQLEGRGLAVAASKKHRPGFGPAGGYSPAQIARAYGINPNAKTKQKVAIVDAFDDPTVRADLNTFDKQYGIHKETKKSFKVINQRGHASPLPTGDTGWANEISLDVQSVRAVCRHCRIILVEADSNANSDLAAAVNQAVKKGAKVVSNSYGGPEGHGQQKAYNHKGVAILASSGDSGWYDWTGFNFGFVSGGKSQTPASFRSVIGVGGTSLFLSANGTRTDETVWNSNGISDVDGQALAGNFGYPAGAAGSGCSKLFKAPPYQRHVKGYASLGCGSKRSEVDIAALADPFTGFDVLCGTGCGNPGQEWFTFGGTSLASPLVAGMWGLAGGPHAKHPAATLYNNYKKSKKHTYDVMAGGTGGCDLYAPRGCSAFSWFSPTPNTVGAGLVDCAWNATGQKTKHFGQCYAAPGYDGVAGVGSPKGLGIFK